MLRAELLEDRAVPYATAASLFGPEFTTGVGLPSTGVLEVTNADFDGDGLDNEIVIAAGVRVTVWRETWAPDGGTREMLASFYVFDPEFQGGIRVAEVDYASGPDEIVVAAGVGGAPHVKTYVYNGESFVQTASVYAFDSDFRGGIAEGGLLTIDVDYDGDEEIGAIAGAGGDPHCVFLDARTGAQKSSFYVGPRGVQTGLFRFAPAGDGLRRDPSDPRSEGFTVDYGPPDPVTWMVVHAEFFAYNGSRWDWADVGTVGSAVPLDPY